MWKGMDEADGMAEPHHRSTSRMATALQSWFALEALNFARLPEPKPLHQSVSRIFRFCVAAMQDWHCQRESLSTLVQDAITGD